MFTIITAPTTLLSTTHTMATIFNDDCYNDVFNIVEEEEEEEEEEATP